MNETMFRTLLAAAARCRGVPFTAGSLIVIAMLGFALLSGRTSSVSAGNDVTPSLPKCDPARRIDDPIPVQLHVPLTSDQVEELSGVPRDGQLKDTLTWEVPITATALTTATGDYDYERFVDRGNVLKYPLNTAINNSNTWLLNVDGTTDTIDPGILDPFIPSLIFITEDYGLFNAESFEFAQLEETGPGRLVVTNAQIAESFGISYNFTLFSATGGEIPDYTVLVTFTRESNVEFTSNRNGLIAVTQSALAATPVIDYALNVGGNDIVSGTARLAEEFISNTTSINSSIAKADAQRQQAQLSLACDFLVSSILSATLNALGAEIRAASSGEVSTQFRVSPLFTLAHETAGNKLAFIPVVFDSGQARLIVIDPKGNTRSTQFSTTPTLIEIDDAVTGTWKWGVLKTTDDVRYAVVAASASPTPTAEADLEIAKKADLDPVVAGEPLTYTISVNNKGPSDATGVLVTDTLPTTLSFNRGSDGCAETRSGIVVCDIGSVAADQVAIPVFVVVDVDSSATGLITNTVMAAADQTDPTPASDTVVTNVTTEADLEIAKKSDLDPVVAGEPLTYTISVNNKGPSDATGVLVTDTLPTTLSFNRGSDGCAETRSGIVVCDIGDVSANKVAIPVFVVVDVDPSALGLITNTVIMAGRQNDPNPDNDSSLVATEVIAEADLSVVKVDNPDPVSPGGQLTYTITAENKGPSDATGVVVTDTLPEGSSFVSASPNCSDMDGIVECDIGDLDSGDINTVEIVVEVPSWATGSILNNVTIAGNQTDPVSSNNTHTETTEVIARDCTLDVQLGYGPGRLLNMDITLGTVKPAIWGVWIFIPGEGAFPLFLLPIPPIDPPLTLPLKIVGFPRIGTVGVFTALFPMGGTPCFAFDFVYTGISSSEAPSPEELRKLFPSPDVILQDIEKLRR